MAYKVQEIEGIGPANGEKLVAAGIKTTDDLLSKCSDAAGRKKVAAGSELTEKQLLVWANMADLMRIPGVAGEFAELLKASGVDTVKELKTRVAANLAAKAKEVNAEKKLTRVVPTADKISGWIEAAKGLEPKITH